MQKALGINEAQGFFLSFGLPQYTNYWGRWREDVRTCLMASTAPLHALKQRPETSVLSV